MPRRAAAAAARALALWALWACSCWPGGQALDDQCKDPLFETHWYGKVGYATRLGGHIELLNSIPTVKTGLVLCPQYNGKASCCSEEFEKEQGKYFGFFRRMIFPSKLARLEQHRLSVRDVMNTPGYQAASPVEREQLQLALERFNPVLHPAVHGQCFATLLQYAAGANCFACRSDWFAYVTQEGERVVRVHVHPAVCMDLWTACEAFGAAALALRQALVDSALAKQAKRPAEDLDMFKDQQCLCDWLHDSVALHPFRRPTEAEREAAKKREGDDDEDAFEVEARRLRPPAPELAGDARPALRRLQEVADLGSDGFGMHRGDINLLEEGRLSGFDTSWLGAGSAAPGRSCWGAAAAVVAFALGALAAV